MCYPSLGCFFDEGPFDYLDLLPDPPEAVGTEIMLYTRDNRDKPDYLSYLNMTTSVRSSGIKCFSSFLLMLMLKLQLLLMLMVKLQLLLMPLLLLLLLTLLSRPTHTHLISDFLI